MNGFSSIKIYNDGASCILRMYCSEVTKLNLIQNLHPGRLTRNLQITHVERNMIFQTCMIMFHVNLKGCTRLPFFFLGLLELWHSTRDAPRTMARIASCCGWPTLCCSTAFVSWALLGLWKGGRDDREEFSLVSVFERSVPPQMIKSIRIFSMYSDNKLKPPIFQPPPKTLTSRKRKKTYGVFKFTMYFKVTPPKTNMSPRNGLFQYELHLSKGTCLFFWGVSKKRPWRKQEAQEALGIQNGR